MQSVRALPLQDRCCPSTPTSSRPGTRSRTSRWCAPACAGRIPPSSRCALRLHAVVGSCSTSGRPAGSTLLALLGSVLWWRPLAPRPAADPSCQHDAHRGQHDARHCEPSLASLCAAALASAAASRASATARASAHHRPRQRRQRLPARAGPLPCLQLTQRNLFTPGTEVTITNWLGSCAQPCSQGGALSCRKATAPAMGATWPMQLSSGG